MPMYPNSNPLPRSTFAALPAASAVPVGYMVLVTNLGAAPGTILYSNGTRWKTLSGSAVLKDLGAPVAGITNVETIVMQTLIPAGVLQANDALRIVMTYSKSAGTENGNITVRIGTSGAVAGDAAINGLNAHQVLAVAGLSGGATFDIKCLSITSVQRCGSAGVQTSTYSIPTSATALPAATAISDSSANALYVSASINTTGASSSIAVQSGQIELITP